MDRSRGRAEGEGPVDRRRPSVLAGLLGLAGALGVASAATAQTSIEKAAIEKAAPVFTDGEAQVVPAFSDREQWIQENLWVEAPFDSDGDGAKDRMHVDVTRPRQTETEGLLVPVIYETSPYYSGTASVDKRYFWNPEQRLGDPPPERTHAPPIPFQPPRPMISNTLIAQWVPRGFAVVHSASPGTGRSQGSPTVGGENESLAPKAVIDWLNGRAKGFTEPVGGDEVTASWCTGKVGMTGTSYNGTLPLAAATTGVEGLEAIIPVAPNTSYYHYYRSNGLIRHPGGYMGEDIDVLYEFIHSGDPARREWSDEHVRDELMRKNFDRVHGDYNEFWNSRNYRVQLDGVRAAVLMAHGFNDWNVMPEHSVEVYETLKARGVPVQAYYHQGGHGGDPPMRMMNRWFTRYLYGVENGVEEDPRAWIVREGAERGEPTPYADYPNPDAVAVELHPTKGGHRTGDLVLEAKGKQGVEHVVDDVSQSGAALAKEERSENRLLFATAELKEAVHLSGTARLRVRLSSNKKAANFSVWLVSLPWTDSRRIYDDVITRGWADPQNHASLEHGEELVPGREVDLDFALEPDDQVVPAGARIGLMLFSSDRDFTLWPPKGTELKIDLDQTVLTLPVVGGAAALERALGGS